MMREILFMGKTRHGKWVYGWFCGNTLNHMMDGIEECSQIIHSDTLYWHVVEPETVGQFTGLTDKNGKKIFEGDILKFMKFKGEPDWLGFVRYDISMFVVEGEQPVDNGGFEVQLCSIDRKRCEIIGNIHDNPELLEDYV